jgi:AraC-like DNA-binding protein
MNVHIILKTALWFFYILLSFNLIMKFRKKNSLWITKNNHIWFWITKFITIHGIAIIILAIILIFFDRNIFREFSAIHPVLFILISITTLMFNPKILYGLNQSYNENQSIHFKEQEKTISKTFELSPNKSKEYKEKIESLIYDKEIYLIKNYKLNDMSNELDIPLHHLSYLINKELDTNYTNLINRCRIEYIIKHRYDAKWSRFSLEGIGYEAGFSSRNTFFKSFKIVTGKTPSEYFKNT